MTHLIQPPAVIEPYMWLVESASKRIGVHKTEGWCVLSHGEVFFAKAEADCMLLLPILEIAARDFLPSLVVAEELEPAYVHSIGEFPREGLVRYALIHSVSEYWPDKALAWLEGDSLLVKKLMVPLERLIENKSMSQRTRHKAKRLINSST